MCPLPTETCPQEVSTLEMERRRVDASNLFTPLLDCSFSTRRTLKPHIFLVVKFSLKSRLTWYCSLPKDILIVVLVPLFSMEFNFSLIFSHCYLFDLSMAFSTGTGSSMATTIKAPEDLDALLTFVDLYAICPGVVNLPPVNRSPAFRSSGNPIVGSLTFAPLLFPRAQVYFTVSSTCILQLSRRT